MWCRYMPQSGEEKFELTILWKHLWIIRGEEFEVSETSRTWFPWPVDGGWECAPGECTFKLPTRLQVQVFRDRIKLVDRTPPWAENSISYSSFLRTLSSAYQDVEAIQMIVQGREEWRICGEACVIIKSMPSVKELLLLCTYNIEVDVVKWAKSIVEFLVGNCTLIKLSLIIEGQWLNAAGVKLLVNGLQQNQALQELELTVLSVVDIGPILEELCRYVKVPTNVLTSLVLGVPERDVGNVAALISNNTRLKRLQFNPSIRLCGGFNTFWDNLGSNTSLENLWIGCSTELGMAYLGGATIDITALVKILIPDPTSKVQPNSSLRNLHFIAMSVEIEGLVTLLQFNTSLLTLTLIGVQELSSEECECAHDNVENILTSLRSNATLEKLNLSYCSAIGGKKVLGMIMDMLLHNRTIKEIVLDSTPLQRNGDDVIVKAELDKREQDNLWRVVKDMDTINPDSARIFLCGMGEAGPSPHSALSSFCLLESTLNHIMRLNKLRYTYNNHGNLQMDIITMAQISQNFKFCELQGKTTLSSTWRSLPSTFPSLQSGGTCFDWGQILKNLFACTAWKLCKPKNVIELSIHDNELNNVRTRGIEVHNMNFQGVNISIWDMAGQEEYHTFHDWMIPNRSATGNCCVYVILCDPSCKIDQNHTREIGEIKQELLYWLQFVASNTRRSFSYRPHAMIVFTHSDLWIENLFMKDLLNEAIGEFRDLFQDLLEVDTHDKSFFIDARSQNHGSMVLSSMCTTSRLLLETLPKEVEACKVLSSIIQERNKRGVDIPFLKWSEFSLMCEEVDALKSSGETNEAILTKKREFVARSLHDGGFIIYFKGIDIVILNPQWFCHDIMGEVISTCATLDRNMRMIKDGVISKKHLRKIFTKSFAFLNADQHFDSFVHMMMKLQVCYEQENDYIMIPSTLEDAEELNWQHVFEDDKKETYNYVGTRLTSKDDTLTMLTSGFFPRLQVFLRSKLSEHNVYKSYKNIIAYIDYGNEIIIACDDGAINIMSRSFSARDQYIVHKKAINVINELRSISTLGCPGVILEEYIMRPQCVKRWFRGIDVRMQVVSKKELRSNVLVDPILDHEHNWPLDDRYGLQIGRNLVKALLGDEEWQEALQIKNKFLEDMNSHVQRVIGVAFDGVQCDPCTRTIVFDDDGVVPSTPKTKNFHLLWNKIEEGQRETQRTLEGMGAKMDQYHKEIKEILETMEKRIIASQQKLASTICSNINELMQFSIQLHESKVPKLAYFCKSQNGGLKNLLTRMVPGFNSFHLHLMCEDKNAIHIVDDQLGCEIPFSTNRTKTFGTIMYWGLTLVTILLKVGAHVIAGAGGMVPDLTKDIMLILDAPGFLDMAQPRGPMLVCLPSEMGGNLTIDDMDRKMAEDWLISILKPMCDSNEIHKKFKLNKMRYTKISGKHAGAIAWVCDHHKDIGRSDGTMERI